MKPVFTSLFESIESGSVKSDPSWASVMIVYNDDSFSISPLDPVDYSTLRDYVACMYMARRRKGIRSLMVYVPDGSYESYKCCNILARF